MHTDKSNWVLLGLLVIVWVGIAGAVWFPPSNPALRGGLPAPVGSDNEAQVVVDFGNGTRRAFAGPVAPGTKALDAMSFAAAAGGLALELAGKDEIAVVRVGDVTNTAERRWEVSLNDQGPVWRLRETEVRPGDRLQLEFE